VAPAWLPDPFVISGDWARDLANLYEIFQADFKRRRCNFRGKRIIFDGRVLEGAYEEGFWHLITKTDQGTRERLFDGRRAECLPWCRPVLCNCEDGEVKVWNWKEGNGKIRTYVWLESLDYVVILECKGNICFLLTAHHVDGNSTRRKLEKKYDTRET